jgi:hypothetical protein
MNWSLQTCRVRADVEERRQIPALTRQEFARRFFGDAAPGLVSQAHQAGFSGQSLGPVKCEKIDRVFCYGKYKYAEPADLRVSSEVRCRWARAYQQV